MDQTLNGTIHPACLQEPPLAMDVINQMDEFGFSLYIMLTFMSCLALLLHLEQCAYIYRKQPYPKKTTIIWISGAAPVIATMSCFGMWIPRAVMITDMTSGCYLAVVVYKVFMLLVEELGGCGVFLQRFSGTPFTITTGPCCCCCLCLPRMPMSQRLFFWLKAGSLQYAILKTAFSILCVVLWTNGNFDLSNMGITGTALWINCFIGVLTIISLWPVAIIFMNMNRFLRSINIVPKYAMYQLGFVLSQLQTSIINILALNGIIACSPPFSSRARGCLLNQQMMIMELFIITLVNRFLYRRPYDPLPPEPDNNDENSKINFDADIAEEDV